MSEEQTNFKVTDRRLFNPDGSPRDVPPEEKPPAVSPATATPSEASARAQPEANTSVSQQAVESPSELHRRTDEELPGAEEADLPGGDDPASFGSFLMSIATNAASSLGMMEHPVSGKREVDLELGKHWIDVLSMLKQKTRGNLLAQEQQILESLLADLQMQYVSLTNAAASKAPRTFTSRDITGG